MSHGGPDNVGAMDAILMTKLLGLIEPFSSQVPQLALVTNSLLQVPGCGHVRGKYIFTTPLFQRLISKFLVQEKNFGIRKLRVFWHSSAKHVSLCISLCYTASYIFNCRHVNLLHFWNNLVCNRSNLKSEGLLLLPLPKAVKHGTTDIRNSLDTLLLSLLQLRISF